MTAVSIKDVAAHAGVSIGTVSNVLNRPAGVTESNRERVQLAIQELGYVRNESARQLRAGRSRFLALVVLDITDPLSAALAHGAGQAADDHAHVLLLSSSGRDVAREERQLDVLAQQRVAGVALAPVDTSPERLADLRRLDVPLVLLERHDEDDGTPSVSVDDVTGGRLAVEHLLDLGHRRIAVVGGTHALRPVADRIAGARLAVARAGLPEDTLLPLEDLGARGVDAGHRAGALLARFPPQERPSAAFCLDDLVALGLLHEAAGRGLRVPEDLAVVGYDDRGVASATSTIPLTSIRHPGAQLGRTAVELLLAATADDLPTTPGDRQVVHQPELVVRSSTLRRPGS